MQKVSKGAIWLLVSLVSVAVLSGCTDWKKKYEALDVEYQNTRGQLERERAEKGQMAQQLAELQKQLEEGKSAKSVTGFEGDVKIDAAAGTITVTLPDTILFDSGKVELKKATIAELDQIISTLKTRQEYVDRRIDIVGHTDSDPIRKTAWKDNWQLSTERSLTVLRYMLGRGIAVDRIRAIGCGESKPVVPNNSASNKTKNRRVEVVVHMK
jgi:chemotaxis protein MotB